MNNNLLSCFQDAIHRPGQIVGPDVNDNQANRIEAPVGQGHDKIQGQLQNDMEVPANNLRVADDEDQVSVTSLN